MFPQEARVRNFTYAGSMTVDLNIKYIVRNGTNYENVIQYNKLLNVKQVIITFITKCIKNHLEL